MVWKKEKKSKKTTKDVETVIKETKTKKTNNESLSNVLVSGIESINFERNKLAIQGYAYFLDHLEPNEYKIKQYLVVQENIENKADTIEPVRIRLETLPSDNDKSVPGLKLTPEATEKTAEEQADIFKNVRYEVEVDLSTLNHEGPLENGEYKLYMEVHQFIDGNWTHQTGPIGPVVDTEQDTVFVSKVRKYAAKSVTTYSLGLHQNANHSDFVIKSKKLGKVNPASLIVDDEAKKPTESKRKLKMKTWIFHTAYKFFTKVSPIKSKNVAFISDSRIELSGNFEYIYEEMLARDSDFKTSFYFKKTNNEPKKLREYISLAKAIATSRYVLLDDFYPLVYDLKIRKGIELIQVWHAVGAFKTFGFSRVGMKGGPKLASRNHRNYTKALVSSENVAPHYAEGFGIDKSKVLPIGAPRTDMFFDEQKKTNIMNKLYEDMPHLKDKKVIMFAPTFRGPGQQTAYYPFDWLDYKALYDEFANQGFVFLFKIHPFVKNSPSIPFEYSDFFYDVSDYREVNDLLLISDVMITDYSSVVFEYSLLQRKTIFFAPDLVDYMSTRNFYVNYLDFIPGPYVRDMTELVKEIKNYDDVNHAELDTFLNYTFDELDGKASARFVDMLEQGFNDTPEIEAIDKTRIKMTDDGKFIPEYGKGL